MLPPAVTLVTVAACHSGPPTYAADVATVLDENCASCHRPEGPAPFALLTYQDAAAVAEQVAAAVSERRMPPWLPSHVGPAFAAERRLSDDQIATLVAWAEAGAPRGDSTTEPAPPSWPSGWALGEPDLVLTMNDTFPVPAGGRDLFRNFVLPVTSDRPRWVRAVELRPDNPRVVHHATMRVDDTPSSRLADAQDSLPGFDEMFSRTEARLPGGFFLGWTPGRVPRPFPDGMGWQLQPGSDFIVQFHLRPTGQPELVSARVGLYFTDQPPEQTPLIVRLGGQTMDIPPGDSAYAVDDSIVLPVDVHAVGAYPHAHYLGRHLTVTARPPGGDAFSLMTIPEWDFNWQDAYRYQEPVALPAGTRLDLRWTFDNSAGNPHNPSHPPVRVVYGPTSSDEMAEFWLQVVPDDPADLPGLAGVLAEKDIHDKVQGWEHLVALDSMDADAHYGLGTVDQARGEPYAAARHYERAIEARPDFAQAHYNLGLLLEDQSRPDEAFRHYRLATEALPDFAPAWSALGRMQASRGDLTGARRSLARAVEADSSSAEALNNLGSVLKDLDLPAQAEPRFRQALEVRDSFPEAYFNLALTLVQLGRAEEALRELNAGLAQDGGNVQAALAVAWSLATDPDPAVRRPEIAGGLADQIRASTGLAPSVADVQAAAYAAAGRFDRAVALAEEGLQAAREAGNGTLAGAMEGRLALYRAGRPYVSSR